MVIASCTVNVVYYGIVQCRKAGTAKRRYSAWMGHSDGLGSRNSEINFTGKKLVLLGFN